MLETLPVSQFNLTGKFDIDEALSWLSECLPDIPRTAQSGQVCYGFKSSLLGTLLQVTVQDNGISVITDNLSVLAIMKDSLSQSAGSRK